MRSIDGTIEWSKASMTSPSSGIFSIYVIVSASIPLSIFNKCTCFSIRVTGIGFSFTSRFAAIPTGPRLSNAETLFVCTFVYEFLLTTATPNCSAFGWIATRIAFNKFAGPSELKSVLNFIARVKIIGCLQGEINSSIYAVSSSASVPCVINILRIHDVEWTSLNLTYGDGTLANCFAAIVTGISSGFGKKKDVLHLLARFFQHFLS